jgi:hypothetical protein
MSDPCKVLHTCDEPDFIFSGLGDPGAVEIAAEPTLGNVMLDVVHRRLFTDSMAGLLISDGTAPKCCSYVGSFSLSSQMSISFTEYVAYLRILISH